jgi:hypothetical protein
VDVFLVIASSVSALAAVGALWLALQTVLETRALRREDRLARLPELVVDYGESLLDFSGTLNGRTHEWTYPIAAGRLRAALAFVDDPLPKCRSLAAGTGAHEDADTIRALTTAALAELADVAHTRG